MSTRERLAQLDELPALVFVAQCTFCGAETEPCPSEGPGETWKTAEQWLYLALQTHEEQCLGRPTRGGQPTIFGAASREAA